MKKGYILLLTLFSLFYNCGEKNSEKTADLETETDSEKV